MPSGRSRNSASSSRYRTHNRDELLALVLKETGDAAEREHKTITQEFERRREGEVARRQEIEEQRQREIIEAQRRERERQARARTHREQVLREIEEEELRATGQWPPANERRGGPFYSSELGDRAATAPTTDEWVVSQLRMASVERRLGIQNQPVAANSTVRWIAAGAAIAFAIAVGAVMVASSRRPHIDPSAYAVNTVSVTEVIAPTATVEFRAPAPAVSRRHGHESSRSIRSAVERSARSDDPVVPDDDTAEPRRTHSQPLDIDLGDADDLWDRGSD